MTSPGPRPLRVAIVGSGPSGFYAAEALFKSGRPVAVDMFERLPTPFGLVRGGVAPDHQRIKNVSRVYEKIAARPGFRFFGNVTVGRDLAVAELRERYDAVILAYGAESDRRLGIPGEDLPGSHGATEFVGWYNAHPDYRDRVFSFDCETAVVVGQGNVAMDVCRMLLKTAEELRHTDIAAYALEALSRSRIREVYLVGRRGPVQAKFTSLELREFGELAAADPVVDPRDLELAPEDADELARNAEAQKNLEILRSFAARRPAKPRRFYIRFLMSPAALEGQQRVERAVLQKNRLEGPPGERRAVPAGERVVQPCGLFLRAIGYRGRPMPGVPFDEARGVIPNRAGRVLDGDRPVPGLYVAGWIKRGPTGVIGTNKPDAAETVAALLEDLPGPKTLPDPGPDAVVTLLRERGVRFVTFEDWKRIDAAEVERGRALGKPREKGATVAELLALAGR